MSFTVIVIALPLCLSLSAQAPPASQPASQPTPPLLSGPVATEDAETPTLVRRSFDGKVESVGPQPDAVAIGMLDLSAEQKAKFDEINSARMSAFDEVIRANYGLVVDLAAVAGESNPAARLELMRRVAEAFQPYTDRGTFFQEMWPHLTDAQRSQAQSMMQEYRTARLEGLRREMTDASPRAVAIRDRLESLGQMVRESIERQVGLEREALDALSEELQLSPEQRSTVEAIFQPLAIKRFQKMEVTAAERRAAFKEFNALLDETQRRKALAILVRQYGQQGAATQPATAPAASKS